MAKRARAALADRGIRRSGAVLKKIEHANEPAIRRFLKEPSDSLSVSYFVIDGALRFNTAEVARHGKAFRVSRISQPVAERLLGVVGIPINLPDWQNHLPLLGFLGEPP